MCSNLFLLTFLQITFSVGDPLVELPNGWIRGHRGFTIKNNTFYSFQKIPYATPPVGNLRFKAPLPAKKWDGVLNTTHMDVICYQMSRDGPESEDCLYLNVYTPKLPGDGDLLPVMFYVHGGGFYDGTAKDLGPDRFIDEGVLYITVNYRLGPFGFLTTGDDVIPGNNGLKDIFMALEWVHNNVEMFGGDSQRVTIFGHSAGGAAVAYLQLYPKTEGMFSGAICQSGTHLGSWALQRKPKENSFLFASLLNNTFESNHNTRDLLDYLLKVPPQDLRKATYDLYHKRLFNGTGEHASYMQGNFWAPVIEADNEDAFITKKMFESVRDGNFTRVPLMIGITSEECIEYYKDVNRTERTMVQYDENFDRMVPTSMEIEDKAVRIEMGRRIRNLYTKGEPFAEHVAEGIVFCSDNLLNRPSMKHAELASKYVTTYFYVFSYDGKLGNIDVELDGAGRVGHGEENKYLICSGSKCDISNYPKLDQLTQQRLVRLWSNFAKFRNPTPNGSTTLDNITWPYLDARNSDLVYLDIGEALIVKKNPVPTYEQWNKLFESLGRDTFATY